MAGSEPGEPGYATEAGRFDTDAVGAEQRRRKQVQAAYDSRIQARHKNYLDREERRFERMDEEKRLEEDKYMRYRADPLMGKKNVSGVPYHPVTLQYKNMHDKSRSVEYNVVSGLDVPRLSTPVDPGPVPNYAHAD